MQAVILAAGRGTRMGAAVDATPKPLLEVAGKTLLEHKFDSLPPDIDEVILIVGYLGGVIHDRFGGIYNDKHILYVEQEKLDGTAGALWRAKSILRDRFIVLYADDIYAAKDMKVAADAKEWTLFALEMELGSAAKVVADKKGNIDAILEREEHDGGSGFVNTGLYSFDMRLFDFPLVQKSRDSDEFGLPQTALAASKASAIPFKIESATLWLQITEPADIQKAEEILADRGKSA